MFPFLLLLCLAGALAKTQTYHFNATYVQANPDGQGERRMIGINGQWPVPTIRVKRNDRVQIHFTNMLDDRNSSLHFHGLFQNGTAAMDGPEMVTQCPIPPLHTFVYDFTVSDQAGTYWYHSHSGAQYADGLRGMFIIEDTEPLPFKYDQEVLLSVSDYYHEETPQIMQSFLSRFNPTGAEPIPQNSLFNDTKNATWSVLPDTTYLLRVVNMGLFTSQYLYIEDHNMTIVEADGVYIDPVEVDSLYLSVAQRYSVLIHTKPKAESNYRFVNVIDQEMLDVLPEELQVVSTNWMVYDPEKPLPKSVANGHFDELIETLNPVNDFDLTTYDKTKLLPDPDYQISLNFSMDQLGNGVTYAFFNNITYVPPKVPTLMTALSSGDYATAQQIYGSNTNTYVLQPDEVVEIVLNNMDPGKHPFHLHGHNFQVISKSPGTDDEGNPLVYDPTNPEHTNFPEHPMVRDTVQVEANGFIVIRFKADNPGVWFFHCHVDWHLEQGLAITLVESPLLIQEQQVLTDNHREVCSAAHISTVGNAAGNHGPQKSMWFDLKGENVQLPPLPDGFTAKGYVALALCTAVALYGVYSIYKFGMEDVSSDDVEIMMAKLQRILEEHDY